MRRVSIWRAASVAGLVLIAACSSASAGTIGPNCDSCFGGIYSINAVLLSNSSSSAKSAKTDTYLITYDLDLTGFAGADKVKTVDSIALKFVSNAKDLIKLTSVQDGSPTKGKWDFSNSNAGCKTDDGSWACLQYISGEKMKVGKADSQYTWEFIAEVKKGALMDIAHIKAGFDSNGAAKSILMSEKVAVNEGPPGELTVLLLSLGAYVAARRFGFVG